MKTWTISLTTTLTASSSVTVEAKDEEQAYDKANEYLEESWRELDWQIEETEPQSIKDIEFVDCTLEMGE